MILKLRNHTAGFFSCLNLILFQIIDFLFLYKEIPSEIDCCQTFYWYKKNASDKLFYDFFNRNIDKSIDIEKMKISLPDIKEVDGNIQFEEYKKLDLTYFYELIDIYFKPTNKILNIKNELIKKYELNFENTCVLFLRGNDKATECNIPDYYEYINEAKNILANNSNIRFLIQSDETEFIETMKKEFQNNIIFYDEIRHISKDKNKTVDNHGRTPEYNLKYIYYFYAIVLIMSECKHVVCNTGNICFWIALCRKHTKNFIQLK